MTEGTTLHKIFALFDSLGWRDAGGTALRIAHHVDKGGSAMPWAIAKCVSSEFLVRNEVTRRDASAAIATIDFRAATRLGSEVLTQTVLLLSSDPIDQVALRIQAEQRMIRDEVERAPLRDRIRLELRPGLLRRDLPRYLLETRPAVVHFSGHGNSTAIDAEDDVGNSSPISTEALAGLFAMPAIQESVQLVVLSSCLSNEQAKSIVVSIPTVMGMRGSIGDDTALAFSRGLYMALGQGLTVSEAFDFGKSAITIDSIPEADRPVLYHQIGRSLAALRPFGA